MDTAIERAALLAARTLASSALLLLIGFAVATLVDGLARAVAVHPIDAVRDLGGLLIAVCVAACFPLAFLERSNITITFIDGLAGPRVAHALNVIAALATACVLFLFAWQFYLHAGNIARGSEVTPMLEIPKAPFWYAVDALLWGAVAVQALVIAQEIRRLATPSQEADASERAGPL